jgi:hypothetical protein
MRDRVEGSQPGSAHQLKDAVMTTPSSYPTQIHLEDAIANAVANDNRAEMPVAPASPPQDAFTCLLQQGELIAFSLGDLRTCPKERWLIHTVLPWADVAMIYGPSRVGKSFVVIDMAMSLASGMPFAGIATDRVAVLYIATEGFGGMPKRIRAWQQHHGKSDDDSTIVVAKGRVDLYSERGRLQLIDFIQKVQEISGLTFRLIVIDTLAKAMGSAKENDNSDVTVVTANAQSVSEAFGATVLLVHHTGKDEGAGPRGASAWTGNVNASIEVRKTQSDGRVLNIDKQKDEDDEMAFRFDLERLEIERDEQGRPITSCVAVVGRFNPARPVRQESPSEVKQMLDLVAAAGSAGIAWADVYGHTAFADFWRKRPATVRGWKDWLIGKGLIHETGPTKKRRLHIGPAPEAESAA